MRMTLPAAFTLLALASPILYASEDPFVGPSIAIGASVGQLNNKVNPTGIPNGHYDGPLGFGLITGDWSTNSSNSSKGSVQPILDFSWNWRIAPTWVAGAGINVETGNRKGAESTIANGTASVFDTPIASGSMTTSFKMSQHAAIYGLIGKQLDENWLLYGKLGYHHAKADSTLQGSYTGTFSGTHSMSNAQSFNLNGVGVGIGTAYNLKNGLELRAEAEYINFGSYTHQIEGHSVFTNKPSMTRVNLMLGYRF